MNNGSLKQNPVSDNMLRPRHLIPAITYGPEAELGFQAAEEKHLIPAITYGPETELGFHATKELPEQKVIFVDGEDSMIMQVANTIEKEAQQEAAAMCEEGTQPAIYFVHGKSEAERAILNKARDLQKKYQKDCQLPRPSVLFPNPQMAHAGLSDVSTCTTTQNAQVKNNRKLQ